MTSHCRIPQRQEATLEFRLLDSLASQRLTEYVHEGTTEKLIAPLNYFYIIRFTVPQTANLLIEPTQMSLCLNIGGAHRGGHDANCVIEIFSEG